MKRTIIYARVSTEEQASSLSLESQIADCSDYASAHGMQVQATMQDIISGRRLDRPGLTAVRTLVANRQVDVLITWSSDRLTRSAAHYWLLHDELEAAHIELHYVFKMMAQTDKLDDENRLALEASLNEYESVSISERSQRGKRQKAKNGNYVAEGRTAPFGYRYVGSKQDRCLEVVETEACVVRRIFALYADGMGTYQIAQQLTKEGMPTSTDLRPSIGRNRRLRLFADWSASSVHEIINRSLYGGSVMCYGVEVFVPAIVSDDLLKAVQACQLYRHETKRTNIGRDFLLRGLITCSCGYKFSSIWRSDRRRGESYGHRRYMCGLRNSGQQTRKCTDKMPSVAAHRFEAVVWEWIEHEVLSESHLFRVLGGIQQVVEGVNHLDRTKSHYYAERARIQQEIERFYHRYGQGKLTDAELDVLEEPRKAELNRINIVLSSLKEGCIVKDQQREAYNWLFGVIMQWQKSKIEEVCFEPPFKEKRRVLETLGVEISMRCIDGSAYADVQVKLTGDTACLTLR